MKKLGILVLVLVMALSFSACSKNEGTNNGGASVNIDTPAPSATSSEIEEFVDAYGATIEQGIEQGAGGQFECKVFARGNKIVIEMSSELLDNLTSEQKAAIQDTYDSMKAEFKQMIAADVEELKTLEAVIYEVCDSKGNVAATINIEF